MINDRGQARVLYLIYLKDGLFNFLMKQNIAAALEI
jgi:hypothetical protein